LPEAAAYAVAPAIRGGLGSVLDTVGAVRGIRHVRGRVGDRRLARVGTDIRGSISAGIGRSISAGSVSAGIRGSISAGIGQGIETCVVR
jgi:hypothetical protein